MTVFNYDELKISTPDTPLSVARWNGLVDQLNRVERTLNSVYLSDAENGRIGIGVSPECAIHIEGTGGKNDDVFIHSSGSGNSAALIFAKSSPNHTLVKKGNLLGKISFRGETGEGFSGEVCMRAYAIKDFKGKSAAEADLRFYTLGNGKMQENLRLMSNKLMLAYGNLEVSGSTVLKKTLAVSGSTLIKGSLTVDNRLIAQNTMTVKGQLTIEGRTGSTGSIVMRSRIAHKSVKSVLKKLGNNQLIIGGAWDDYMYFFWKNKKGQVRRAAIKGSSF